MDRKEIVEVLNHLEESYPTSQWMICGMHVWPLLKIQIFFHWYQITENKKRDIKKTVGKRHKRPTIATLINSFFAWTKLYLSSNRKIKYIFSGAASHRDTLGDFFLNRYFDPLLDYLEKYDSSILMEQSVLKDKNYYKRERIIDLPRFFPLINVFGKLKYKRRVNKEITGNLELNKCIKNIERIIPDLGKGIVLKQLIQTVQSVLVWSIIFDLLFDRYKPSFAFGLCYYTVQMFGMNFSAHKKGIATIDMQHGTQGPLHVAYNGFKNVPSSGYELLPKIFWCWDHSSEKVIEEWTRYQTYHSVIVGGNPWISHLVAKKTQLPLVSKKVILYTLQPIAPLFDPYIIETIRKNKDKFEWWLRLHPRQMKDKPKLIEILSKEDILHVVNVEEACDLPLPLILQFTSIHISKFSGSIIEAALMGVPNIIIDEIGVSAFQNEINNGQAIVFLDRDPIELSIVIDKLDHKKVQLENINFETILKEKFIS
jgi:hypothetical protein